MGKRRAWQGVPAYLRPRDLALPQQPIGQRDCQSGGGGRYFSATVTEETDPSFFRSEWIAELSFYFHSSVPLGSLAVRHYTGREPAQKDSRREDNKTYPGIGPQDINSRIIHFDGLSQPSIKSVGGPPASSGRD